MFVIRSWQFDFCDHFCRSTCHFYFNEWRILISTFSFCQGLRIDQVRNFLRQQKINITMSEHFNINEKWKVLLNTFIQ